MTVLIFQDGGSFIATSEWTAESPDGRRVVVTYRRRTGRSTITLDMTWKQFVEQISRGQPVNVGAFVRAHY